MHIYQSIHLSISVSVNLYAHICIDMRTWSMKPSKAHWPGNDRTKEMSRVTPVICFEGHECRRARVRVQVCECVRVRERRPQSRLA